MSQNLINILSRDIFIIMVTLLLGFVLAYSLSLISHINLKLKKTIDLFAFNVNKFAFVFIICASASIRYNNHPNSYFMMQTLVLLVVNLCVMYLCIQNLLDKIEPSLNFNLSKIRHSHPVYYFNNILLPEIINKLAYNISCEFLTLFKYLFLSGCILQQGLGGKIILYSSKQSIPNIVLSLIFISLFINYLKKNSLSKALITKLKDNSIPT